MRSQPALSSVLLSDASDLAYQSDPYICKTMRKAGFKWTYELPRKWTLISLKCDPIMVLPKTPPHLRISFNNNPYQIYMKPGHHPRVMLSIFLCFTAPAGVISVEVQYNHISAAHLSWFSQVCVRAGSCDGRRAFKTYLHDQDQAVV